MNRETMESQAMTDFNENLAGVAERTGVSLDELRQAAQPIIYFLHGMAAIISRYELDQAYFMAGGLSDLALMQGQPF